MGRHGGLNILFQKSWNVYNFDNRLKVAEDEKKFQDEEDKKRKRALQAEHEHRIDQLKEKAKKRRLQSESDPDSEAEVKPDTKGKDAEAIKPKHINFFEDIEHALSTGGNPEHEAEVKVAKDKEERQTTTFLGEGSAELKEVKPWYYSMRPPPSSKTPDQRRREEKRREEEDPLVIMRKNARSGGSNHAPQNLLALPAPPPPPAQHQRLPHTSHDQTTPSSSASQPKSVERLREERLQRERAERAKIAALIRSKTAAPSPSSAPPASLDAERRRKYNQSFSAYTGAATRR